MNWVFFLYVKALPIPIPNGGAAYPTFFSVFHRKSWGPALTFLQKNPFPSHTWSLPVLPVPTPSPSGKHQCRALLGIISRRFLSMETSRPQI